MRIHARSGGRVPPDAGPASRATGIVLVLATAIAIAACGAQGSTPPPVAPGSPIASPSAAPTDAAAGTPGASASPGTSPSAIPASVEPPAPYPGADLIGSETLRGETVVVVELHYDVPAWTGDVRAHYRRALREDGWRVGEVELDGAEWEIEATRGGEEIEIEIEPAGARSLVEVAISMSEDP